MMATGPATLEKVQIRQYGMEEPEESVALA
jgi:hypothetical protein